MLDRLKKHLENLKAREQQAHANFNAIFGARQFCEQLIKELREEEDAKRRQGDPIRDQDAGSKERKGQIHKGCSDNRP